MRGGKNLVIDHAIVFPKKLGRIAIEGVFRPDSKNNMIKIINYAHKTKPKLAISA